ncbi:phosphoribosylanthranilate isomerase [Jiella sp. MQZ9-1]|uniref:N-(5'-phosphoribosyl)anthranilate isomerase n=1 Tax=Jiella flava TaxID=2816857 RepID=A0A939FV57_9HYPH|nr:phosphoribosylanthranilate isomerase [Jiella flava]MBO0661434.1 phosphoribosylanthranilate isomerase [Jiella flava]MCD2470077.1 phosphoribosylanthranilate isomerase [Jiella flava]
MKIDVKICGLSTPETLEAALTRGASHVGFIHFAKSPRHLEIAPMADLVRRVDGRAETVIVSVDPDDALVDRMANEVRPDCLQLHGRETPERVAAVRAATGIKVMKALSIAERADLDAVATYRGVADRLLLDSKRPKGSQLPGGNGVSFDWTLLALLDPEISYILSGGLDAANVGEALRIAHPAGIDVSSGVESAPGIKDITRIHAFFDALDDIAADTDSRKASAL